MNVRALPQEIASHQNAVVRSNAEAKDWWLETRFSSHLASHRTPQGPFLVGRDAELAYLYNLLEKAMSGERQIAFVSGEAGIGKTTLVDTFVAQLHDRIDIRITSGQCVEQYGPGEAYMPLLEAIVRLCRGSNRERLIEDLKRYAPSLLVQLPGLLDPAESIRLQEQIQGTSRERMLREMAQAAELFTVRRGLVLVLEDLHWSDVSTLEWLSYIARRREPAKLFIIGTYRPTDILANGYPLKGIVQELQSRRLCKELRVTPLSEEAIAEYLYGRFGDMQLPEAAATTLARRTGGNPLFVVNTVDYFVRQGAVTQEAGRWTLQVDKIDEVGKGIPDTLRQLIERQVERLSKTEQRLLEVASVTGVEFTAADVAAGLSTAVEEVEACCERFTRAKQWVRAVGFTELPDGTVSGRYSFLHAMYQEVIKDRIAEIRRIQLHRRIALNKEAVYGERAREIAAELAVHFEQGRESAKAVYYLSKAGETAIRRNTPKEAIAYFSRGLALLATLPDSMARKQQEVTLQVALGAPLLMINGYAAPEVAHAYGRARELCQQIGEQPELFPALFGLCSFYLVGGQLQTAQELAQECVRLAQHTQDASCLAMAYFALGVTLFYRGELMAGHAILERANTFYDPQFHGAFRLLYGTDPGVACRGYASVAKWLLGYPEQALQQSHDALTLARQLSHSYSLGFSFHPAAWLRQYRREEQALQTYAEEQRRLSEDDGFVLWFAIGTILCGYVRSKQGNGEQGLSQMKEGLCALRATGTEISQPYHRALLAEAYGKNGQGHEGLAVVDEALSIVGNTDERYYEAELYRLKGELMLQQFSVLGSQFLVSDPQPLPLDPRGEAEACFLRAIEIAQQQQAKSLELRAVMSLARLRQQQVMQEESLNTQRATHSALAEAHQMLSNVYNWFTEGFDTKDLQDAVALLRELDENATSQKSKVETGNRKLDGNSQFVTPNSFRSDGEYWTVRFAGTSCHFRDALGLHYIAQLLQQPHQEVHVITLLTPSVELSEEQTSSSWVQGSGLSAEDRRSGGDAMEMLDPQARAAYKQRLHELREELEEAQQRYDFGRSEQLAGEIDFLTQELANAVGLGGRTRRLSLAERARVNVSRAIKVSLRKISEHHPVLGQHLTATIKTGTYCSYTPDPRVPVSWEA